MPTPAFPHDQLSPLTPEEQFAQPVVPQSSPGARHIEVDGKKVGYVDAQLVWSALATMCGLPATVAPIARSEQGLPIGVQIIGPYLEDRTTLAFAELIEREFGGFLPPPGFAADPTAREGTPRPLPAR
jgi:amidase